MRWHFAGAILLPVFLLAPAPLSAQPRNLLDLLPASTLATLEVRQPAALARELNGLSKGSALEDLPAVLARFRAAVNGGERIWMLQNVAAMAMFVSPEIVSDCGRCEGALVALTGFDKDKQPEVVFLVQPGESAFPAFMVRAFLTLSEMHIVAEVEGVPIFREKSTFFGVLKIGPGDAPPIAKERGPAIARLPGLDIYASSTEAVREVIRRFKKRSAEPALSSLTAYRNAARDKPGLFGNVNLDALIPRLTDLFKTGTGKDAFEPAAWTRFKALVNPEALRSLSFVVNLQNGKLDMQFQLQLNPGQKSPLLDLLPDQAVRFDTLRSAPADTTFALALDLSGGDKRWQRVVQLLDSLAAKDGADADSLPSKKLAELEETLGLTLGKDIWARFTEAGVVLVQNKKSPLPTPVFLLQASSPKDAQYLQETGLPRLASMGAPLERDKPEQVGDVTLTRLPGAWLKELVRLPVFAKEVVLVGRQGSTLVVGNDRDALLTFLARDRKESLLSQDKVASAIKDNTSSLVGIASLGSLGHQLSHWAFGFDPPKMGAEPKQLDPDKPAPPPANLPHLPDRVVEAYAKASSALPPLLVKLDRKPDQVLLTIRQPGLKGIAPHLIDVYVQTWLSRLQQQQQAQMPFGIKKN